MIDLEKKVFGGIIAKEIIGEIPPAKPDTQNRLESELAGLLKDLENKSRSQLIKILEVQKELGKKMNSKPGAMALPQDKIHLFMQYNEKYVEAIKKRLN